MRRVSPVFSRTRRPAFFAALALWMVLCTGAANAGEFGVSPIRMDFDRRTKTSVVTVSNNGDEKLHVEMNAKEWTQDADGKDLYSDTSDIVYFPKIMEVMPHSKRIVRAGIKMPPGSEEKTYRLFIREMPEPKKNEAAGGAATVNIAMQFAIPLFVKPLEAAPAGAIKDVSIENGELAFRVANTGNVHFKITSVTITGRTAGGEDVFTKGLDGWYLLDGASRPYVTQLPTEDCQRSDTLDVRVVSDAITFDNKIDVEKNKCLP